MTKLDEIKLTRKVAADLHRLSRKLTGVKFELLRGEGEERAYKKLDQFVTSSRPVHGEELSSQKFTLDYFDFDLNRPLAIRFARSESGTWFVCENSHLLVDALSKMDQEGLSIFDIQRDVLYTIYEAEYQWEYYIS